LGYDELNDDLLATGNYLVGETQVINWKAITFTNNTLTTGLFAQGGSKVSLWHLSNGAVKTGHTWNNNQYFVPLTASSKPFSFALNGAWSYHLFPAWQLLAGFDTNSTWSPTAPTGLHTFVRPNVYEKGRAHVIVYNWSGAGSASVDLSGVLNSGDRFEVRHGQDFYGAPVMNGTYAGGSVSIPLVARKPANPLGTGWRQPPTVSPVFNVFVVIKQ
jgi:hypothetical protein